MKKLFAHKGLLVVLVIIIGIFAFWPRVWSFGDKNVSLKAYGVVKQLSDEDAAVIKQVLNGKTLIPDNYFPINDTWSIEFDNRHLYYSAMPHVYPNVLYDDKTNMHIQLSNEDEEQIRKVFEKICGNTIL